MRWHAAVGRPDSPPLPRASRAVHGAEACGRPHRAADDGERESQPAGSAAADRLARSISRMSTITSFSSEVLRIDAEAVADGLQAFLRETGFYRLRRKGVVVGLSGGIDISVVRALAAKAL